MSERRAEILLVEDNEGDILLTKKAFEKLNMPHYIHVARDGEIALEMLHQKGPYESVPEFDLILLDLNLPKRDGKDVLQDIKGNPALKDIPVIMLSSSRQQMDILKSYELNVNSYIVKPRGMEEFIKVARAIETCWFNSFNAKTGAMPKPPPVETGQSEVSA